MVEIIVRIIAKQCKAMNNNNNNIIMIIIMGKKKKIKRNNNMKIMIVLNKICMTYKIITKINSKHILNKEKNRSINKINQKVR